ncbi:hypothetical protein [Planktothricoides raciborskii]|uniref:Uncharacterized protein n=1 Tax=Planktothricoides raciborskii GIHE-MW2 TaxID=2792601 RepID=A0AAU8JIZ2_9CYAN
MHLAGAKAYTFDVTRFQAFQGHGAIANGQDGFSMACLISLAR